MDPEKSGQPVFKYPGSEADPTNIDLGLGSEEFIQDPAHLGPVLAAH